MTDDLMRRMRDHVGYDPERIVSGEQPATRAERRAAERVLRAKRKQDHKNGSNDA